MKATDYENHQAVGRDLVDAIRLLLQEARLCGSSRDGWSRGAVLCETACELAGRLLECFPGEERSTRTHRQVDDYKAQLLRRAP